jgi:two-component sensor histidine kinase
MPHRPRLRDTSAQKRQEEARTLLTREVDHRARNALAVVQSIVQLTPVTEADELKEAILGRVSALARAHGSLALSRWEGAPLAQILGEELAALTSPERFALRGSDVLLPPARVQPLGMIVHELATNAAKYGALSTQEGRITVTWSADRHGGLSLTWSEDTGRRDLQPPTRAGFGSRLMDQLARQMDARLEQAWAPSGLTVTLVLGPEPAF